MTNTETIIAAELTFHVKNDRLADLFAKALEVDEEPLASADDYTVAQALQVVWVHEPEWLHRNVLLGWTMDSAGVDGGPMKPVWD